MRTYQIAVGVYIRSIYVMATPNSKVASASWYALLYVGILVLLMGLSGYISSIGSTPQLQDIIMFALGLGILFYLLANEK